MGLPPGKEPAQFLGVVGTMIVAFVAMLVIEEKPLAATMPAPRR